MPIKKSVTNNSLYPVLDANELFFKHPRRVAFLKKLQPDTGLQDSAFQELYSRTLTNFVELVQAFPSHVGGKPGSLMDESILRAASALKYYRTASISFSVEEAFAIFTAALFADIGKVISLHAVMLSNERGEFIAQWTPTDGSIVGRAQFYKLRPLGGWTFLGSAATHLLARQCIPEIGFALIAQDRGRLTRWLQGFFNDTESTTELGDALKPFYAFKLQQQAVEHLPSVNLPVLHPPQTALGEQFADWLGAGLRDNTISEALYFLLPSGMLVLKLWELLQLFCQKGNGEFQYLYKSQSLDWRVVFRQFTRLGFTRRLTINHSKLPETLSKELTERMANMRAFFTGVDINAENSLALEQEKLRRIRPEEAPLWDELSAEDMLLLELFYFYYGVVPSFTQKRETLVKKPAVAAASRMIKPGKFFTRAAGGNTPECGAGEAVQPSEQIAAPLPQPQAPAADQPPPAIAPQPLPENNYDHPAVIAERAAYQPPPAYNPAVVPPDDYIPPPAYNPAVVPPEDYIPPPAYNPDADPPIEDNRNHPAVLAEQANYQPPPAFNPDFEEERRPPPYNPYAGEPVAQLQPQMFVGMVIPNPELLFWQHPLPAPVQNLRPMNPVLFRLEDPLEQRLAEWRAAHPEMKPPQRGR